MARNQSAFVNWSQYLALRLATGALHMFSPQRNLKSARGLGTLIYQFDRRHRQRAIENISACFPQFSTPQVQELAEGAMQHFLQLGVEVLFTTRAITLDTWADHIGFDGLGPSLATMLQGKPTLLVTGHYGNWEVLGYLLALMGFNIS